MADQVSGLLDRRGVAKAMDIIERNIQWRSAGSSTSERWPQFSPGAAATRLINPPTGS